MSDTPETDHLEVQLGQAAMHSHPILWEHGRRMERERDEARAERDKYWASIIQIDEITKNAGMKEDAK